MANEQNLRPCEYKLSREEAKRGGQKSGESRRNKKIIRDCLEILLEKRMKDQDGITMTGAEAIALTAFQRALNGDMKAMEFVRDTAGQKPADKVLVADVDPSVIAEVEAMVNDTK